MGNKIQISIEAYEKFKAMFSELDKELKGVTEGHKKVASDSSSSFGKIKENWLAITAAVAAATVAVNKSLDYMAEGAKAQQAEASFRQVATAAGESADEILEAMKRASNGTVDDSDIMQKAVKGMLQGLSGEQMVNIMEAARVAARTSGEDVGTAFEKITDAIANQMPRALQQMGLITKEQLQTLNEEIASGQTNVDLYSLAMANASEQLSKFGELQTNNAERMQKWKAMFSELKETIGTGLLWLGDNVIEPFVVVVEKAGAKLAQILTNIGSIWSWVKSGFSGGMSSLFSQLDENQKLYDEQASEIDSKHSTTSTAGSSSLSQFNATTPTTSGSTADPKKELAAWKAAREAEINYELGLVKLAEKEGSMSKAEAAEKSIALYEELLETQKKYLANINLLTDPTGWNKQQQEILKTKETLLELNNEMKEQTGTLGEGFSQGIAEYLKNVKTAFQQGKTLADDTAKAMEQSFSDLFFDAMTGDMKDLSSYLTSFLNSIARSLSNRIGENITDGILGSIFGGSSTTSGASLTNATTGAYDMVPTAHSGGLILHSGGYVPRFHVGGLSSDERPAILQTGEGVLSRRGMAAFDAMNNGQAGGGNVNVAVNIDNKSSQQVNARQTGSQFDGKKWVVSMVLEDLNNYGPLHHALKAK